jgi:hypothetical protein
MGEDTARRAPRTRRTALDVDLEHWTFVDPEHVHLGKPNKDLAHPLGILHERWAQEPVASHAVRLAASLS